MKAMCSVTALLLLAACPEARQGGAADSSSDDTLADVPVAWCDGATAQAYQPLSGAALELWPDDFYTRDAPDSPTGMRLSVHPENAPWIDDVDELLRGALLDLNVLSGFGRNAGAVIRFTGPVGSLPAAGAADWEESLTTEAIQLLDLSTTPATRVPYEVATNAEDHEVILWPLRPLKAATLHAVVVTTDLQAADGGCISPSQTLRELLTETATDPALTRLHGKYAELLSATGIEPARISAASVFTTHDDLAVVAAAAADIRARDYSWVTAPSCTAEGPFRRCEGSFEAWDYRDATGYIADADPTGGAWTLDVTMWLPNEVGSLPYPTLMFGHGLSGHRDTGEALASRVAPLGLAVVAVDALEHGDHPTASETGVVAALEFLGINLVDVSMQGLVLRGNFNQSLLDRLQLIELLRAAPDIDGDGGPDVDTEAMGYHGISLGGMMGSPLLALSDAFEAGVLSVAGGRLLTFATDNSQVDVFKPFLYDLLGGEAEFVKLLTVAQALVDAADPATFAAHVLHDRLIGAAPSVLMHVAITDDTVPPVAGKALARALGLPHLGPVLDPVRLLQPGPTLPTSANLVTDTGAVTAGFFQMDRVSDGDAAVVSTHDNTPFSREGELQLLHFFTTWRDTGDAEILDPYAELGTPEL